MTRKNPNKISIPRCPIPLFWTAVRYIRYSVELQLFNPLHLPLHSRYRALQAATSSFASAVAKAMADRKATEDRPSSDKETGQGRISLKKL
jgi:hypothetical protein